MDRVNGFIRRIFGEAELLSGLPDGKFPFEKFFDEAKPLSGGKIPLVDPPGGEVLGGVAA
jgi:hypothetical protein